MKISIITVCLNSEQTIEQTIQSVIGQMDCNCEYIIVDGGSADKTKEILERYKHEISTIISEPDNGLYDAMNKGIALATGEIIGIINSDDWYEPGTFETVRRCFQESDAEVIYGNMNQVDAEGNIRIQIPGNIERLRYEMVTPHPTVFVKRSLYEKYGAFHEKYTIAADYDLMLRLYTKGIRFFYCDKVLANFRLGGCAMQHAERCVEESLLISKQYLVYAPLKERSYYKKIIWLIYKTFYFIKILDEVPFMLPSLLRKKLGVGNRDNIAVFGAGRWGTKVYEILVEMNIYPLFFVDNDRRRWNSRVEDIEVLSPEVLRDFEGVLLIIVKEVSSEIKAQIEGMGNPALYCITWDEIAEEFIKLQNMEYEKINDEHRADAKDYLTKSKCPEE